MQACYHENVEFSDPVFGTLKSNEAKAMWHMLCESGSDLEVSFSDVATTDLGGTATWDAKYTLGGNDRPIHNIVTATFVFDDDRILRHRDEFDLWKWSRMALGTPGTLLGWSSLFRGQVREKAKRQLERFITNHLEYQ